MTQSDEDLRKTLLATCEAQGIDETHSLGTTIRWEPGVFGKPVGAEASWRAWLEREVGRLPPPVSEDSEDPGAADLHFTGLLGEGGMGVVRAAHQRLEKLHQDQRFQGRNYGRSLVTLASGILWTGALLIASHLLRTGVIAGSPTDNLLFGVGAFVEVVVVGLMLRRVLFDNRIFRSLMMAVFCAFGAMLLGRVVAVLQSWTLHQALMVDFVIWVACLGMMSSFVSRTLWWVTAIAAVTCVGAAFLRDFAVDIMAGLVLTAHLIIAYVVRPSAPSDPDPDPEPEPDLRGR